MLKHLLIRNYALIDHLEISPSKNLNIITGETGAGKSIMLGAVGLLLGKRADTKVLLHEESKCVVEGQFDLSSYNLQKIFKEEDLDYEAVSIFRREISPNGKSRAFINDTPVTLDVMKRIGLHLMDVHSQHETLNLGKEKYQLAFVDAFAEATEKRKEYARSYKAYKSALDQLEQLISESRSIAQESDYNNFLLEELTKAQLKADEQEELEEMVKMMENAEEIKLKFNESLQLLSQNEFAASEAIVQAKSLISQISKYSEKYDGIRNRLESISIELHDIIAELEKEEDQIEYDPEKTTELQDRLSLIYQLQQKHDVQSISSLLDIQEKLQDKADKFINIDDEIERSTSLVERLKEEAQDRANALSKLRESSFESIEKELEQLLFNVGIPDAAIRIVNEKVELTSHGIDNINILFSANKGIAPQELSKVASGGEFSRLMFCVKFILADKISLPTIIFDEIDTGVSGEIALKLGEMMKRMANNHQVITISHLPQIAAKGSTHYYVFKDNTNAKSISKIKTLNEEERIEEIAKMIGGDKPTLIAVENAKELISAS